MGILSENIALFPKSKLEILFASFYSSPCSFTDGKLQDKINFFNNEIKLNQQEKVSEPGTTNKAEKMAILKAEENYYYYYYSE